MIEALRRFLRSFTTTEQPRFSECAIVQVHIEGLHRLAEQTSARNFLSGYSKAQSSIENYLATIKAVYHSTDIGDLTIGIAADRNPNFLRDALKTPDIVENAVKRFIAESHLSDRSVRFHFGLSFGEAFFSAGNVRFSVAGETVNEAGYALITAEKLGIRIALDEKISQKLSIKEARRHTIYVDSIAAERSIVEPLEFP